MLVSSFGEGDKRCVGGDGGVSGDLHVGTGDAARGAAGDVVVAAGASVAAPSTAGAEVRVQGGAVGVHASPTTHPALASASGSASGVL